MTPIGGLAVRFPPGIGVRPLVRDDLDSVIGLVRSGRELSPVANPGDEHRRRFDRLLADADVVPLAAISAGRPVGITIVRFQRRLNYATFEGVIEELVVEDGFRGRGVGHALLEAAIAEWRLRGAHRLGAHVPTAASAVRRLLSGMGFAEGFLDLRRDLRPLRAGEVPGLAIREPENDDGVAATRILAEFGPRRSPVPDRLDAVLRTFRAHVGEVRSGRAGSRVAVLDGAVVGICTLHWVEPFWTDDLHAWLPDLVVTEPMRGRGVGRALLSGALALSAARGARQLSLETAPHRAAARALYRSAGFAEIGSTVILPRTD